MRPALLVICAVVACARAASIGRDLAIIPALETEENGQPQKPVENNSSEEELVQQTITVDQVGNDLRSQNVGEVHIPVAIVQEVYPVLKSTVEVNKPKDSDNEVKPPKAENDPDDDDEVETPKPGFFQQSIQTLQALQQAATLTVQNALKPQNDDQTESGTGTNPLQQSFAQLQHVVQSGIQSLNQTVANILNRNPDTQSEEGSNQNIITTIQHNFQNSVAQFNQTFQNFIHPSEQSKPESSSANEQSISQVESDLKQLSQQFNIGLKSASDGIEAITKQETTAGNATSPSNPFPFFQNLFSGWWQNIQNLNSTVLNIFPQGTQADEAGNKPNVIVQGIQNIQNLFTGQRPSQEQSNDTKPTNGLPIIGPFQNWIANQQQNVGSGNSTSQPFNFFQNFQNTIQNGLSNFRPPAGAPEKPAGAAAAGVAVVETSSKRALIDIPEENKVEAADTPRKKGGGSGASGDNNDSSGDRVEEVAAEVKPEPAVTADTSETAKSAERIVTE